MSHVNAGWMASSGENINRHNQKPKHSRGTQEYRQTSWPSEIKRQMIDKQQKGNEYDQMLLVPGMAKQIILQSDHEQHKSNGQH
jgi:hypothetical protein